MRVRKLMSKDTETRKSTQQCQGKPLTNEGAALNKMALGTKV